MAMDLKSLEIKYSLRKIGWVFIVALTIAMARSVIQPALSDAILGPKPQFTSPPIAPAAFESRNAIPVGGKTLNVAPPDGFLRIGSEGK